jgi:hypothetical protein
MYSFATPPVKLEPGQQIGDGLVIANHLDRSVWCANQRYWEPVRSYLLHSFLQVHRDAAPFTSHRNVCNYVEPKPAYFYISSSKFNVQDRILSTPGDALKDELILYCRPFPVHRNFDFKMKFPPCTREPAIWGTPCSGCFARWNTHPQCLVTIVKHHL